MGFEMNTLYYGDNLEIVQKYINDESVDLVYLDPPFNSKRAYNIIFKDKNGKYPSSQIEAFDDTWQWCDESEEILFQMSKSSYPAELFRMLDSFRNFLGASDMIAYLVMMSVRLWELHRVLKPTGSLYLHCDPTSSHYLKILMDQIFGVKNFRNEIIWNYRRWPAKQKNFQRMHDIVLRYSKTDEVIWNQLYEPLAESTLKQWGEGKQDAVFDDAGKRKRSSTLDEKSKGAPMRDVWDISIIAPSSKERLGYPTQKPLALLDRIIQASSKEDDLILDSFCGCGTTVVAAEKLGRKWIGIDISILAVNLIEKRLKENFPDIKFNIVGIPNDVPSTKI